jgi:hypothetical protein
MSMETLKPCPFCGNSEARHFIEKDRNGLDSFGIQCRGSECAITGPECDSPVEAAAAWNRRAPAADAIREGDGRDYRGEYEALSRALVGETGASAILTAENARLFREGVASAAADPGNEQTIRAKLRLLLKTAPPPPPGDAA